MKAVILQHTSAPVQFDPPPADPREQPVSAPSREGTCAGCGLEVKHHWTISNIWIGCTGALSQARPPRNPERWNDPRPGVTCAVRAAMLTKCGPALEIFLAGLTHDEVLAIAAECGRAAVTEYVRSVGK